MTLYMSEKEVARLQKNRAPKAETKPKVKQPRQNSTDSSRQDTLDCLAGNGWTMYVYDHRVGEHYFRNIQTGATTPRCTDYDACLDAAREEGTRP